MRRQPGIPLALALAVSCAPLAASAQADDPYLRALQLLRKTVLEQENTPPPASATNQPPPRVPTFEELEQQYLAGQLTARQFQQYVLEFKLKRARATPAPPATPEPVVPQPVATVPGPPAAPPTNAVVIVPTTLADTNAPPSDAPTLDRLAAMEARMDQIIQEKAARDKVRTNKPPTAAAPQSKREKLDHLLRELIAGKITEEQYRIRWAAIAAEKE